MTEGRRSEVMMSEPPDEELRCKKGFGVKRFTRQTSFGTPEPSLRMLYVHFLPVLLLFAGLATWDATLEESAACA